MSDVVTATRQVLQDLLVPEMRELRARIEAVEARMQDGFANVEKRFDAAQKHTDGRLDEIRALIVKQLEMTELRDRLSRPEAQQAQQAQVHQ